MGIWNDSIGDESELSAPVSDEKQLTVGYRKEFPRSFLVSVLYFIKCDIAKSHFGYKPHMSWLESCLNWISAALVWYSIRL